MIRKFNEYEQDGMQITEYTKDGTTVSHTVKTPVQTEPQEPEPTLKEIQDTQMAIMSGIFDIYVSQLGL